MKFRPRILIVLLLVIFGCSSTQHKGHVPSPEASIGKKPPATQKPYKINGIQYTPLASATGFVQDGIASWYGRKFHGRKTANGETYNMHAMTAAHKTLPLGTWVNVQNLENNRKIVVRINDRGPFVQGRIIDLSHKGAKQIGIIGPGTAQVRVTALGKATSYSMKTKDPLSFEAVDYWKGNFTVQVGAFQVKANADNLRDKLSKTYQNAHVVMFDDDRGRFYRVRIGRFTNLKDALQFSDDLIPRGFDNTFAVAE